MAFEPQRPTGAPSPAEQAGSAWSFADTGADAPLPGELKIKEPRSWKTWQLATAAVVTALFGMLIGNLTAGGSASQASGSGSGQGGYELPPPASASGSSTPTTSAASSHGASATTIPTATTATTVPASATTTTAPGVVSVLLGPYQSHGNWVSGPFTIAEGQWNIGWAFECTPAPAGPDFEVFALPADANAATAPAVSETGASGQSVTSQTTTGSQKLEVEAGSNCVWAVKVTGVG